jgi:hypothetical protein
MLLDLDGATLDELNVGPFTIAHHLAKDPRFELPRLVELARAMPESAVEYNAGNVPVDLDPAHIPANGLSIPETIRRIETCGSWMVLKWVENDPTFGKLLNDCLDEVMQFSERVAPGMKRRRGFIFITSPGSVTPFHFDQEYNFLLQIRGSKTVHVFPPSISTEREVEERFAVSHRNLHFQDAFQKSATTFQLSGGIGLHIPVAAPHWVKNGNDVSVSFSITFHTPASERRSALYRANSHIRSLGLTPCAVGRSKLRDSAKYFVFEGLRHAARPLKKLRERLVG